MSDATPDSLVVVPDPNRGEFEVRLSLTEAEHEEKVTVLNTLGTVVYSETFRNPQKNIHHKINIAKEVWGVYYVNVQTPEKRYQKKFLKK